MDKRNFVIGHQPSKADFDGMQNDMEDGLNRVARLVAGKGIHSGFDVRIAGSTATVSAGMAFDGIGNPIVADKPVTVDLGTITRPAAGKYKWATIILRFQVSEAGTVKDLYGNEHPAQYKDSLAALVLQSDEGTAAAIKRRDPSNVQVPIIDIRVDATSPWENLVTDLSRRPSLISVADASSRLQRHEDKDGRDAHGATSAATAGQIVVRDAHGRAQVAAPAAPADIARKDTVDGHAGLNSTAAVAVHGIRQGAGNGFDADKLDGKQLDDVLMLAWPIGSVYIQFPGERSPQGLLPGTWTKLVFPKGYFFRVEGSGARAFDNIEQLDAFQGHAHYFSDAAGSEGGGGNRGRLGGVPGGNHAGWVKAPAPLSNGAPRTADETRPINKTVRIWRRSS